jgi:hypothetical protein
MGRSPRLNKNGGRDHYGELTSLLLAGGGLQSGQVIGKSDHQAAKAATYAYRPPHLMATVLSTLFDLGELRLVQGLPREITGIIESGDPIAGLS